MLFNSIGLRTVTLFHYRYLLPEIKVEEKTPSKRGVVERLRPERFTRCHLGQFRQALCDVCVYVVHNRRDISCHSSGLSFSFAAASASINSRYCGLEKMISRVSSVFIVLPSAHRG